MQRRTALGALLALAPGRQALAQPATAALWPAASWPQRGPETSGWQPARLQQADEQARLLGSDSVLVVHRGAVVHSYGDVTVPRNLYSVRKSILSMLIGMHLDRIDLDATLGSLGIDDKQPLADAEKAATVRQLLLSRSGVYHPAAYEMASAAAKRPARGSHAPGSFWYYNNWDFNVLGTVFAQRCGVTVFDALERDLAQPLQLQDFDKHTRWFTEGKSHHAAYTMQLSARDLARLGLLMCRGGQWNGKRLLSEDWVALSTRPHTVLGWQAYGYMWWVPQRAWPFWQRAPGDVFHADGNYGQFLWVDRARDLVIVHQTDGPSLLRTPIDAERVSPLLERLIQALPAA
jgi:CubicO group peptidase (beta-lactamase class C family)